MAVITGTAALVADAATSAATASRGSSGTAALVMASPTMSASGKRGSNGVGVLQAQAVGFGTGDLEHDCDLAALAADPAELGGVGSRGHKATASLAMGAAALRGLPYIESISFDLVAEEAELDAAGFRGPGVTANLVAGAAVLVAFGNVSETGQLVAGAATLVAVGSVYRPDGVGELVAGPAVLLALGAVSRARPMASPATLSASGKLGHQGTANLVAGPAVIAGVGAYAYDLDSGINVRFQLGATFTLEAGSAQSLELEAERAGYRRSFPALVYVLDALLPVDVNNGQVPDNRWFLVDPLYVQTPGDGFVEQGAKADYIGFRSVNSPAVLVFRAPVPGEVVWYVPGDVLYRYEINPDTRTYRWVTYRSMPERSLIGQRVFEVYDPDGIYLYYARIWGAMQWRFAYDSGALLNQVDPTACVEASLAPLAAQYGLKLDFDDPVAVRRAKVGTAVEVFKLKGTDAAVSTKLRAVGLLGYAQEVWVDPEDPSNFQSTVLNRDGVPSSGPDGAGTVWRVLPHNYVGGDPADYWGSPLSYLTSRLVIMVNNRDGSPIDYPSMTPVEVQSLHDKVYRELRYDVLPAHVDIRHFGTDMPLPAVGAPDVVEVDDTLVITNVIAGEAALAAGPATMAAAGTVA